MKKIKKSRYRLLKVFISFTLILFFLLLSTIISIWPKNYFWIERNEAEMPVWVKGNINSGVFVVFNHGGPGSCGTLESIYEVNPANGDYDHKSPLNVLEKNYAVVYWDQRHSGQSKGYTNPDDSRPEDFGEDLALVIKEIKKRYKVKTLILLGQSWGYFVSLSYLTYITSWEENQSDINGLIIYKGNHDQNLAYKSARTKMLNLAEENISKGEKLNYWVDTKRFYNETTSLSNIHNSEIHYSCINEVMNISESLSARIFSSVKASFFSNFNGWRYYINNSKTRKSEKFMN